MIRRSENDRDQITRCSICCQAPVGDDYPRRVCRRCDSLALNDAAAPAFADADSGRGDNPVFIEGRPCWRLFESGFWVTLLDVDNCRNLDDFCRRNKLPLPPEP
jgi:hypothetical protein